jgi:16S rRNA (adenine1518-N6/adenine1519-N6)-dimethyltransferase
MHSYISSPGKTTQILKKYGIKLSKKLGQNFLIDTNSAKKIVSCADVSTSDVILEVGSGVGSLTQILLSRAKKVVCVEIDRLLARAFEDIFREDIGRKIKLICSDALKLDYGEMAQKYGINKLVSNLPYSIAAPLVLKILLESPDIKKMFITIQKDIALRMLASVGDKNYSSYTVKTRFLADFESCFQISRNCFIPRPFVDSAVVEATRKDDKILDRKDFDIKDFFDFVTGCFSHRRKKLVNSLAQKDTKYCHKSKIIIKLLSKIGRDMNTRAEELSLENYIFMYKNLTNM